MVLIKCQNCNREIPSDANVCPYCEDRMPMMSCYAGRCWNCEKEIPRDSLYCPYCASQQEISIGEDKSKKTEIEEPKEKSASSKTSVAAILAISFAVFLVFVALYMWFGPGGAYYSVDDKRDTETQVYKIEENKQVDIAETDSTTTEPMVEAYDEMVKSVILANKIYNQIVAVWEDVENFTSSPKTEKYLKNSDGSRVYNATDALLNLYDDPVFHDSVIDINLEKAHIHNMMEDIREESAENGAALGALEFMYEAYLYIYGSTEIPQGSLSNYKDEYVKNTEDFNDAANRFKSYSSAW